MNSKLFLYGRHTGTIHSKFDIICQPFIQQKIVGVTTENGIKMSAPLNHAGQIGSKNSKITDLAEQLYVLNDLFMKYDHTQNQNNQKEIEDKIKNSLRFFSENLSSVDKKNSNSFAYGNMKEMMRSQSLFLDVGFSFLEFYNLLGRNLDQVYFTSYLSLLKRGEFDLPNLMWDDSMTTKLDNAKQKMTLRYQKFLYQGLSKVFDDLNNTAMSSYQKKFIEYYLAMSYFRIPEFRFKFITAIGSKEYNGQNEEKDAKIYLFTNWNNQLFGKLKIDQTQYSDSRTLLTAILEKPWLERLKSRGIFYFFFIKEISVYLIDKLQTFDIVWNEIPGYDVLLANFIGQMKSKEIIKYPEIMIEASIALLKNINLLDRFVIVVIEKTKFFY